MKPITFVGDSLAVIRAFPSDVRAEVGVQLHKVQLGLDPLDWKPMSTVGPGVREIRVRDETGAFRVIYVAQMAESVVVLHAFQKKTQKTAKRDIDVAIARLKTMRL